MSECSNYLWCLVFEWICVCVCVLAMSWLNLRVVISIKRFGMLSMWEGSRMCEVEIYLIIYREHKGITQPIR